MKTLTFNYGPHNNLTVLLNNPLNERSNVISDTIYHLNYFLKRYRELMEDELLHVNPKHRKEVCELYDDTIIELRKQEDELKIALLKEETP